MWKKGSGQSDKYEG
jgi:hypothetical protein